jgi:hypothetical protein
MILGLTIPTFTLVHVIISLIAIISGLVVLFGMFGSHRMPGWTALFLLTTALTTASGFLFPNTGITPAQIFGYISLVVIAVTLLALYVFGLGGAWRWIYVVGAVLALYLNVFVLVVQSFAKIPALHPLAPNGNESPFLIVQGAVLVIFCALGLGAAAKFHPERYAPA